MFIAISQRNVKSEFNNYRDILENNYVNYYESYGIRLIPIPNANTAIETYFNELPIKGVILSGGQDVNPKLYNQKSIYANNFSELRDKTEKSLLEIAIEKNLPVFCNCRGMQFMNVFFGGSLIQSIKEQLKSDVEHLASTHDVKIIDTKAYELGKIIFSVNSYHSQAIIQETLSKELRAFAISKDDNIIEGIYHPDYPIVGIQWHPERSNSDKDVDDKLIRAFISGKLFWEK